MSVSANVYVGFFIKLNKTILIKTVEINACTNDECKEFHNETNHKFCSECGTKITKICVEDALNLRNDECYTHHIVSSEYEGVVYFNSQNPNVLEPSGNLPCSKHGDIMYESFIVDISLKEIEKHKPSIENNSKLTPVIKYLNDTYGEGTAELSYGVIAYAN